MSKAHRARILIDLAGMALALGTMFAVGNFWIGLGAAVLIFIITHAVAGRAFATLASPDEVREDLEDRKNGS